MITAQLRIFNSNVSILLLLIILSSNLISQQSIPKVRPWNGSGYSDVQNLSAIGIASDFGPRNFDDKWHGGIDYNTPGTSYNDDYGDLLIASISGVTHDVNKLIRADNKGAYPVFDIGDYRLLYVHQFYDGSSTTKTVNNSTVTLKYMDAPNDDRWAMIFIMDGDTTALGQINGTVKLGVKTINVTNYFNEGDPIGVIGTSGGVGAHLHLNSISDSKDSYDGSDNWNKNPLQFIDYEDTTNTLTLYSQVNNTKFVPKYPGNLVSPMVTKVRMDGEPDGSSHYHHVMAINKVLFEIKSKSMDDFDTIRSDNKLGYISLGGEIDSNQVNQIKGQFGSFTDTGMKPLIYTSSQPWDLWHYSDFMTRIHKDDVVGDANSHLFANCPTNSRYIDGRIELKSTTVNIRNVRKDSITQNFTLDNFKPFVESVSVNLGQTLIYNENWSCSNNNNCVTFSNNNLSESITCNELQNALEINIRMSEHTKNLSLTIPEFGITNQPCVPENDSINFSYTVPPNQTNFTSGTVSLEFSGLDMNNNSFIIFPSTTGCQRIPKRSTNTAWDYNTSYGVDKIHKFNIACSGLKAKSLSNTTMIITECEVNASANYNCENGCINLEINGGEGPYTVNWERKRQGPNWIQVAGWPKNGLDGNNGLEDLCGNLEVGTYRATVTDALCGNSTEAILTLDPCSCVMVEESEHQNVSNCNGSDDTEPPTPPSQSCDGALGITVSGQSTYSIMWSNGATTTNITNLCTGTYTVTVTTPSCSKTLSFEICCCNNGSVNLPPYPLCTDSGITETINIDGDITSPTTTNGSDGSIDLHVNGNSNKYKWSGPNGFSSASQDISGLGVGTYCVTVTNGCTPSATKCFTLKDCSNVQIFVSGTVVNTCKDYQVGSISLSVGGGVNPYKFKWSNGEKSSAITNLAAGQYCVTVTDLNGCKNQACFNVGINDTSRNGCTILCNGNPVKQLDVNRVFQSDCRYVKYYCSDGYFLGTQFLGTYSVYNSGACTLSDVCYNGSVYNTISGTNCTDCIIWFDEKTSKLTACNVSYCYFGSLNISVVNSVQELVSVTSITFDGKNCKFEAANSCLIPSETIATSNAPCNEPPFKDGNCSDFGIVRSSAWQGAFGSCGGPSFVEYDSSFTRIIKIDSLINVEKFKPELRVEKEDSESETISVNIVDNNVIVLINSNEAMAGKLNLYNMHNELIISIDKPINIGNNRIVLENLNFKIFGDYMYFEYAYNDKYLTKSLDIRSNLNTHDNSIMLTPNPTNDILYISKIGLKHFEIKIISITGKVLFTKTVDLIYNANDKSIDMSFLNSGSYIIEIKDLNETKNHYFKIIKI